MSMLNVFQVAGSALHAQSLRLNTTASNLANADSVVGATASPTRPSRWCLPPRRCPVPGGAQGVRVTQVVDSAAPMRLKRPEEPAANAEGYVTMPNVNVVEEMTNMISASRAYQTNADMMGTAKSLMERPWPSASKPDTES